MKMEFLPDGSLDCPLIGLYDFDTKQACHLHSLILQLANGTVNEVSLHEAFWMEAIDGCSLILLVADTDQGIIWVAESGNFFCNLRFCSWASVAELVSNFCVSSVPGTFQWLDETSPISWLLSPSGFW